MDAWSRAKAITGRYAGDYDTRVVDIDRLFEDLSPERRRPGD